MELKDNILSIWKTKDKHKTSSLRPTFVPLSARASEKKSTLGDTFSPSSATAPAPICQSLFSRLSYPLGGVQSPLTKPMGPPPGISYPSVSAPYGRVFFPLQDMLHGDQSQGITLTPWWDNHWGQQYHTAILSCHSHQTCSSPLPSTRVSWTYHPVRWGWWRNSSIGSRASFPLIPHCNKWSGAHCDSFLIWSWNIVVHLTQGKPKDEHFHLVLLTRSYVEWSSRDHPLQQMQP